MSDDTPKESKPKNALALGFPIGLPIGIGVGTALGVALDNLALGIALGVSLGMAFSVAIGGARLAEEKKKADNSTDEDASE
jgi:ABC-type antimicrobial peptide transport system permease subunit